MMKPTAYLINTTCGVPVDEAALADAPRVHLIAGTIDAFRQEPPVVAAAEPR
jgi:phosphoglycerate dehydrogenase-like enzyme